MATRMSILTGGVVSIVLTVFGIWAWSQSPNLAANTSRPDVAGLAVRSGAIGVIAISQLVLLIWVVGNLFRRNLADDLLKLLSLCVSAIALIAAVALGLASR